VRPLEPRGEPRRPAGPGFDDDPQPGRAVPEAQSGVRILRPQAVAPATLGPAVQAQPVTPETPAPAEPDDPARRAGVLGVNIAGPVAHLAVVHPGGQPRLDLADTLVGSSEREDHGDLGAFYDRAVALIEELGVGSVAVARPMRYTNWTYSSAFERVSLETCFAIAAHTCGLRFESLGQHHAANVVGLPLQGLADALRLKLRIERSVGWQDRWPALLVALAVGLELEGLNLGEATRANRP
jgi:hypothetical protein